MSCCREARLDDVKERLIKAGHKDLADQVATADLAEDDVYEALYTVVQKYHLFPDATRAEKKITALAKEVTQKLRAAGLV